MPYGQSERKCPPEVNDSHLAAIVSFSNDMIFSMTLEGIITTWNSAAERFYGYSAQEIIGQHIENLIPAERRGEYQQAMDHIREGQFTEPFETERLRKDGTRFHVETCLSPICDASGQVIGASIISRAIHERKLKEAELLQREEERAYIMQSARCLFWLTDVTVEKDGRLNWDLRVFDEAAARRLLPIPGRTGQEYIWAWHAARLSEDRERTYREAEQWVREGRDYQHEFRMRATDGKLLWMREDVHVESLEPGERWRLVGVCTDITEQKIREEALRRTEKERSYVLYAAHCLLWYADIYEDENRNLYWDCHFIDEAEAQAFMPVERRPGENYFSSRYLCRHPEDREKCDALGIRMIRSGQSYVQEFRTYCSDGTVRWTREDVQVETVVPGELWRVACLCTDVTEIKEQQRALQSANDRLRRAMTETHHRVKNNLQIIAAMVDLQAMEGAPTFPASALHRLGSQVKTLASVHNLLTRETKEDIEARSLDASQILSELIPMLRTAARGIELTFEVDPARLTVSQAAALAQVVNELTTNAIKHARSHIRIAFKVRGEDAFVFVEDDGPGFPPGFNAAVMANIGLELVQTLVNLDLRGAICFENRSDGGGRVLVSIPRYAEAMTREAETAFHAGHRGG